MIKTLSDLTTLPHPITARGETFPAYRDDAGTAASGTISSTSQRVNIMGTALYALNVYLPPLSRRPRGVSAVDYLTACVRVAYARESGWASRRGIGHVSIQSTARGQYTFRVQAISDAV